MKKIAILIENMFDEQELIYPYHRLKEDYQVELIGSEADTKYTSKSGYQHQSDKASRDVSADDYAGLYIPGGFSPDYMRRNQATLDLVKAFDQAKKPIAAICHGPWLLASVADLTDRDITSYPSIKHDLIHAGAKWHDEPVVVSQHLVTSRSPADLTAHVKKFVELLEK